MMKSTSSQFVLFSALAIGVFCASTKCWGQRKEEAAAENDRISFHRDVRPIFQIKCYGCHQGAKQAGQYIMTSFDKLVAGGESGSAAIVPGNADKSYLVELIEPVDGEAEMPRDDAPLNKLEIALIRQWINEGAKNDTPARATAVYSKDNPPKYQMLPTVTSLDISPDGKKIAVAGYHEVLIHDIEKSKSSGKPSIMARLVGLSERIESVQFSPDGNKIVVCGGSPGRMGEIQIWDLGKQELLISKQVGYDTLYGAAWSGDGKKIAFGCPDKTIRAIDAKTGEQVLFNGAHNDWVLDTVFSTKNDHLITVSRDRSMKLIKVDTQRFVDNITSITPGALKGGLNAVDCHPTKDELLCAGADGVPKVYRMLRTKARKIGDDFNLIRAYPKLNGRVFDAVFSNDGKRIAAASSINTSGQLKVFETETGKELCNFDCKSGGLFTVSFLSDNKSVATAGFDGVIRIVDGTTGDLIAKFDSAPVQDKTKNVSK